MGPDHTGVYGICISALQHTGVRQHRLYFFSYLHKLPVQLEDVVMEALALLFVVVVWMLHTRTKSDLTRRIQALETDLYSHLKAVEVNQD